MNLLSKLLPKRPAIDIPKALIESAKEQDNAKRAVFLGRAEPGQGMMLELDGINVADLPREEQDRLRGVEYQLEKAGTDDEVRELRINIEQMERRVEERLPGIDGELADLDRRRGILLEERRALLEGPKPLIARLEDFRRARSWLRSTGLPRSIATEITAVKAQVGAKTRNRRSELTLSISNARAQGATGQAQHLEAKLAVIKAGIEREVAAECGSLLDFYCTEI